MSGDETTKKHGRTYSTIEISNPTPKSDTLSSSPTMSRGTPSSPTATRANQPPRTLASSYSTSSLSSSPGGTPEIAHHGRNAAWTSARKEPEKEKSEGAILPRSDSDSGTAFKTARPSVEREFSVKEIAAMDLHVSFSFSLFSLFSLTHYSL